LRELSLHILDIVENGIAAGADLIRITVQEARSEDRLTISVEDNGHGIPPEKMDRLTDPFVTSRASRKVGLGLPLLAAAAERCEGKLDVASRRGKGTRVQAVFRYSHVDRAPLGDMAATITTLIMGNPGIDFVYRHVIEDQEFKLDTRQFSRQLNAAGVRRLAENIRSRLKQLESEKSEIGSREESNGQTDD